MTDGAPLMDEEEIYTEDEYGDADYGEEYGRDDYLDGYNPDEDDEPDFDEPEISDNAVTNDSETGSRDGADKPDMKETGKEPEKEPKHKVPVEYDTVIDNLIKLLEKDSLTKFINFMARHPELTIDNCAMLFLENGDADLVPRYFRDMDGVMVNEPGEYRPMAVLGVMPVKGNKLTYRRAVMLPVAEDPPKRIPVKDLIRRIGFYPAPTDGVEEVVLADSLAAYPSSWNEEQAETALLGAFVDYFWENFSKCFDGFKLVMSFADWRRWGCEGVKYMATRFYNYPSPYLSGMFYKSLLDTNEKSPVSGWPLKRYRLTSLWLVFSEFEQMCDGRHYTLAEEEMMRFCGEHIYDTEMTSDNPLLEASYRLMCARYSLDPPAAGGTVSMHL